MTAGKVIKNFCFALENQIAFITEDLEEQDYYSKPDESTPSIGWIFGHILISLDFIVNYSILGNKRILPDEMFLNYNTGSSGEVKGDYDPTKILEDFKRINKIVVDQILTKPDEWFDEFPLKTRNFPKNWLNKNNMKVFVLYFNHSLNHTGQILELKRKLGKRVWGV